MHTSSSSSGSLGSGSNGDFACALFAAFSTSDIISRIGLSPFEAIGLGGFSDSPSRH